MAVNPIENRAVYQPDNSFLNDVLRQSYQVDSVAGTQGAALRNASQDIAAQDTRTQEYRDTIEFSQQLRDLRNSRQPDQTGGVDVAQLYQQQDEEQRYLDALAERQQIRNRYIYSNPANPQVGTNVNALV